MFHLLFHQEHLLYLELCQAKPAAWNSIQLYAGARDSSTSTSFSRKLDRMQRHRHPHTGSQAPQVVAYPAAQHHTTMLTLTIHEILALSLQ